MTKTKKIECPICLSNIHHTVFTDCEHVFCDICLMKHMLIQNNCPLCRKIIDYENIVEQIKKKRFRYIMTKIEIFYEKQQENNQIDENSQIIVPPSGVSSLYGPYSIYDDMNLKTYIFRTFALCFRLYLIYCLLNYFMLSATQIYIQYEENYYFHS